MTPSTLMNAVPTAVLRTPLWTEEAVPHLEQMVREIPRCRRAASLSAEPGGTMPAAELVRSAVEERSAITAEVPA